MSLREHLLAAQQQQTGGAPPAEMGHTPTSEHHSQHSIDPAIAPPPFNVNAVPMDGTSSVNQSPDVKKGRRELSNTKRAAQNRAAQRAFRQRKEAFITSLKEQLERYKEMEPAYNTLREYVLQLQSRLVEHNITVPPSPIPLTPRPQPPAPVAEPVAPTTAGASASTTAPVHEASMSPSPTTTAPSKATASAPSVAPLTDPALSSSTAAESGPPPTTTVPTASGTATAVALASATPRMSSSVVSNLRATAVAASAQASEMGGEDMKYDYPMTDAPPEGEKMQEDNEEGEGGVEGEGEGEGERQREDSAT